MYQVPPLEGASIRGIRQTWRRAGSGARLPIVLLHGIGSNARAWAGQFPLAVDRQVCAWNAPGYGGADGIEGSAILPTPWPSARDFSDALAALLDHLNIGRCLLVGQSLGAIMATTFAVAAPQRVAALLLASPANGYGAPVGGPVPPTVATRIEEIETLGPRGLAERRAGRLLTANASAAARELVTLAMSELTIPGYQAAARLLAVANIQQDAARLQVPTLIAWGSEDCITPPQTCRAVADAVPAGRAIELPNLGHGFAVEDPRAFNRLIDQLDELAQRRGAG